jgi:molecular chaperone GrpE
MSGTEFDSPKSDLTEQKDKSGEERNAERKKAKEEPHSAEATLERQLESEIRKSEELSRRAMYLQADLVNTQRQVERRVNDARDEASIKYLEELISVKEDLERALSAASDPNHLGGLTEGLSMLLSKIDSFLEIDDVARINVDEGERLDTRFHEVVAYSDSSQLDEGSIVSVIRNGYTFKGKVIKTALVEVAKGKKELGRHEEEISVNGPAKSSS